MRDSQISGHIGEGREGGGRVKMNHRQHHRRADDGYAAGRIPAAAARLNRMIARNGLGGVTVHDGVLSLVGLVPVAILFNWLLAARSVTCRDFGEPSCIQKSVSIDSTKVEGSGTAVPLKYSKANCQA